MIYKEKFKIGLKDIGIDNGLKNNSILEYLENIASYHSDSLGYGINTIEGMKTAWIVLGWKIKVIKRPKYGQSLNIHTWSREMIKLYAYHDFEIYDENDELCVVATSKWILIDIEKGRFVKATQEMLDKYESEPEKLVFEKRELKKIEVPSEYSNVTSYIAQRRDIDVIGHMHNLYYLDLAYEALPKEVYSDQRPFENIEIMYKKEVKLDEEVICKYTKSDNKHIIVIESKDKKTLHTIIELW